MGSGCRSFTGPAPPLLSIRSAWKVFSRPSPESRRAPSSSESKTPHFPVLIYHHWVWLLPRFFSDLGKFEISTVGRTKSGLSRPTASPPTTSSSQTPFPEKESSSPQSLGSGLKHSLPPALTIFWVLMFLPTFPPLKNSLVVSPAAAQQLLSPSNA